MALTRNQIIAIQVARRRVPGLHDEDTWRLLLRNCAGVWRDATDKPRLSDKRNGNDTYEEVMYRLEGLGGTKEPSGHWANKAEQSARRVRHALHQFAVECQHVGLLMSGGLEGFIERMTSQSDELGEPTRDLDRCNLSQVLKIKHGLVAWMRREGKKRSIPCPRFGKAG